MMTDPTVPFHPLVLSLSQTMDGSHPGLLHHQMRTAYIATRVARRLGTGGGDLRNLFLAAALHDVGLVRTEGNLQALRAGNLDKIGWHAEATYELLRTTPLLAGAAEIARHHHLPWSGGKGAERHGQPVLFASHILVLADTLDRAIDRTLPVLEQVEFLCGRLTALQDQLLHPDAVGALLELSKRESFWLDCVSLRLREILLEEADWPMPTISLADAGPLAEMLARVVDAKSRWTATHSAGVAAVARALAREFRWSAGEARRLHLAGLLHDWGKLSVPSQLLDKPDRLSPQEWAAVKEHAYHTYRALHGIGGLRELSEWAAFHHERLDGSGYPFHLTGEELPLGARILAVADTFTALTEERPYRKAMTGPEALATLEKERDRSGLDGDVFGALKASFAAVDAARQEEQSRYLQKQNRLMNLVEVRLATPNPAARLRV